MSVITREFKIKYAVILFTVILSYVLGYISISVFKDYGWTVFLLIPFLMGFIPTYVLLKEMSLSIWQAFGLGMLTLSIASTILLLFAIEGIICIAMASPILIILVYIGVKVAYKIYERQNLNHKAIIPILGLLSFASMSFDYAIKNVQLHPVKTSITINAPIQTVWDNIVCYNKLAPPKEWLFSTGVSYPQDAIVKGKGVGAIRYCNFSTGSFVEPITTWDEPNLLEFTVKQQPIPMFEYNPFWDNVHPPHLDGYFKSHKGQFKLTKISDTQTLLEGTTWYSIDLNPEFYWVIWSEYIIHAIHERVLNHIKNVSEEKNS
jgi:hypothetical protein